MLRCVVRKVSFYTLIIMDFIHYHTLNKALIAYIEVEEEKAKVGVGVGVMVEEMVVGAEAEAEMVVGAEVVEEGGVAVQVVGEAFEGEEAGAEVEVEMFAILSLAIKHPFEFQLDCGHLLIFVI